jgi:hypothetical protein
VSAPAKHPLDMDLDLDPDEFAQVVEMISRPPRFIPKLAEALRRHHHRQRDKTR